MTNTPDIKPELSVPISGVAFRPVSDSLKDRLRGLFERLALSDLPEKDRLYLQEVVKRYVTKANAPASGCGPIIVIKADTTNNYYGQWVPGGATRPEEE